RSAKSCGGCGGGKGGARGGGGFFNGGGGFFRGGTDEPGPGCLGGGGSGCRGGGVGGHPRGPPPPPRGGGAGTPAGAEQTPAALTAKIRAIHAASGGQYGVPRVLAELRAQGHDVGRKRVARLMKAAGLRGRRPARWVRTTTPEPTPPTIPDLVHGQFEAPAPD